MKRNIFAAILLLAFFAYSCTTKEEPFQEDPASSLSDIALVDDGTIVYEPAVMVEDFILDDEENPDTKTVLTIDGSGAHFTFATGDRIGVFPYTVSDAPQMPFTLKSSGAESCYFNCPGFSLKSGVRYAAYYPYNPTDRLPYTAVPVNYTGQTQTTAKAPGASDASFNISSADYLLAQAAPSGGACPFKMSHVGTLMVIDLTVLDTGTYTELSICSDNASFVTSGYLNVGQTFTAGTSSSPTQGIALTNTTTSKKLSLALGSGSGISLTAGQTYRFCMMVYPIDLSSSLITFKLKDSAGKYHHAITPGMTKNFRQGYAYRVSAAIARTNLSTTNGTDSGSTMTANTYIVDTDDVNAAGYKFYVGLAGNGVAPHVGNYTLSSYTYSSGDPYPTNGSPSLNADRVYTSLNQNSCVSNVSYSGNYVYFKATGAEGNAKLTTRYGGSGADDTDWNVWTWLIWCTDKPGTVTFTGSYGSGGASTWGYSYEVMDRNIGALTNGVDSSNYENMYGMYYQLGNVMPYTSEQIYTNGNNDCWRMLDIARNPHKAFTNSNSGSYTWFKTYSDAGVFGLLWGGGSSAVGNLQRGSAAHKTMYDPCPPGFKVTPIDFKVAPSSANNYGFYANGCFFPYNGAVHKGIWGEARGYVPNGDTALFCCLWSSASTGNTGYYYHAYSKDVNRAGGESNDTKVVTYGMGIRCVHE